MIVPLLLNLSWRYKLLSESICYFKLPTAASDFGCFPDVKTYLSVHLKYSIDVQRFDKLMLLMFPFLLRVCSYFFLDRNAVKDLPYFVVYCIYCLIVKVINPVVSPSAVPERRCTIQTHSLLGLVSVDTRWIRIRSCSPAP